MQIDLAAFRHDLHAHPETGLNLPRTAAKVADVLEAAGLDVQRGIGTSGVVATLHRGPDDTALAFRADMDALPITEATGLPYASTTDGQFHGCGHDGHTTMLLGAALELAEDPALERTVHFLFQADEETGTGAQAMIDDGLFDRFPISAVYGLHNFPGTELGHLVTGPGPFCAFEDNFEIRVTGRGGHASMPEAGIDPLVVASAIVLQLQTIVSRSVSGSDHAVVSVTEFVTDGARNILPTCVTLSGDCRGYAPEVSVKIEERMRAIAHGVAAAHGAEVEVHYATSFRPLLNDPAATDRLVTAAQTCGTVDNTAGNFGFSEDFAAFLRHRPGAFALIGNGDSGPNGLPLHNPGYDFNDAALAHGMAIWRALSRVG